MDFTAITEARGLLDALWQAAWLRGRCWGPRKKGNPYSATNITIAIGGEIVSISQGEGGKLEMHEFTRTKDTFLGRRIREMLEAGGLSFTERR